MPEPVPNSARTCAKRKTLLSMSKMKIVRFLLIFLLNLTPIFSLTCKVCWDYGVRCQKNEDTCTTTNGRCYIINVADMTFRGCWSHGNICDFFGLGGQAANLPTLSHKCKNEVLGNCKKKMNEHYSFFLDMYLDGQSSFVNAFTDCSECSTDNCNA